MAQALLIVGLIGTAFSAMGQAKQGQQDAALAKAQAQQLERNADAAKAVGQRQALEVDRQGQLQQSRALAIAGASGTDPSSVSTANHMADLAGESHYRRMVALYEGETQGDAMTNQAKLTRYSGKAAKEAGNIRAASTALSGASSMYSKYGFDNPSTGSAVGVG